MASKVKSPSLYFNNKKVGELQKIQYIIETNDGHEVTDAGTFFTDGVTQAQVNADLLLPTSGLSVPITLNAMQHKDVSLNVGIVDGKIHSLEARATKLTFDGDVQNGKATVKCEFMCKEPSVTGTP